MNDIILPPFSFYSDLMEPKHYTPKSSCLPDFDQLSCSPDNTRSGASSNNRKTNNSRAKSRETTPPSLSVNITPVKNAMQGKKSEIRIASPRRKRYIFTVYKYYNVFLLMYKYDNVFRLVYKFYNVFLLMYKF